MTIRTETFVEEPNLILYAHPKPNLSTWNITGPTSLCIQSAAPNKGLYTIVYDDAISDTWGIFIGTTQPTSWFEQIAIITPDESVVIPTITLDPQVFSNVETGLLDQSELHLFNNEVRLVLFALSSGTFGDIPLKFVIENEDGTILVLIENLQSVTNALVVTIPPLIFPQGCCKPTWSIRRMSGNTVVISGSVLISYAATN